MNKPISIMIGIRTGGIFAGETDMEEVKARVNNIIEDINNSGSPGAIPIDLDNCMSKELVGNIGSYVVIAGIINNWALPACSNFAKALSKEFKVHVMFMYWDEDSNITLGFENVQSKIFIDGDSLATI